jgi:hypothetical protein
LLLLKNVEYCKNNKKYIKPLWLKKDIYDIDVTPEVMERNVYESEPYGTSINISTSVIKGLYDRGDGTPPARSENTFSKTVKAKYKGKKNNDRSSNKMSTMSTMYGNSRKRKSSLKIRGVSNE